MVIFGLFLTPKSQFERESSEKKRFDYKFMEKIAFDDPRKGVTEAHEITTAVYQHAGL